MLYIYLVGKISASSCVLTLLTVVQKQEFMKRKWELCSIPDARFTAQKMKFSNMDFLRKCDQIRSFLRIWSHLLKKSLMEKLQCLCSDFAKKTFLENVNATFSLISKIVISIEIFRRHIKGKYALKYFFRNMKMLKICFRDGLHLLGCCIGIILDSLHRKRNFSFNIFWVNVNKSTINFGFVHVY